jgi:hypoxanthine phosphoribosyltransferase
MDLLLAKDQIAMTVDRLASKVSHDYRMDSTPVMLGVLSGAFIFMADLVRQMTIDVDVDFIKASSYVGTQSSGTVSIEDTYTRSLSGVPVIVVDDVLDSGRTTSALFDRLSPQTHSMSLVCLLRKPSAVTLTRAWRRVYIGHDIGPAFVYGYGMDLDGRARQHASVYVMATHQLHPLTGVSSGNPTVCERQPR